MLSLSIKMSAKRFKLSTWVKFASQNWLFLDLHGISDTRIDRKNSLRVKGLYRELSTLLFILSWCWPLFWFCFNTLSDWFTKLAPLSEPTRDGTTRRQTTSSALHRHCIYLSRSLIGWLDFLSPLWFVSDHFGFGFGMTASNRKELSHWSQICTFQQDL